MNDAVRSRLALPLVVALGVLARLPLLTTDFAKTTDMASYRSWSRGIAARGLARAYEDPTINYPPLSMVLFDALGRIERAAPPGLRGGDALLNGLLKGVAAAADVATALLLAAAWRRAGGTAAVAAAAYLFNPAVFYVSAWWGQLDSVYAFFLVWTVALVERAPASAGACYVAALGTKLQAISLAPLLPVVVAVRRGMRGLARAAGGAAVASAVLIFPWVVAGRAADVWHLLTSIAKEPSRVDVSAYNLWYLLFGGRVSAASAADRVPGLPLTYRTASMLLFGALACAVALLASRRSRAAFTRPALAAACLALGLFVVATRMHERHGFAALPLLLLAAADERGSARTWMLGAYAVVSATFAFNLVTIAPFTDALGINLIVAPESPRTTVLRAIALLAAAANVAVVWALFAALSRRQRAEIR